jgi:hypothetical protein
MTEAHCAPNRYIINTNLKRAVLIISHAVIVRQSMSTKRKLLASLMRQSMHKVLCTYPYVFTENIMSRAADHLQKKFRIYFILMGIFQTQNIMEILL